jgi:putative transposase
MINGIRCRAYPSFEQSQTLSNWIGCARVIYNAKVAEMLYFQTFSRKALGADPMPDIDQAYSHFKSKDLTPYLYDVPSQILRNASTQFMTAWQRHLKGLASRPTFKAKGQRDSVTLTSELFSFELVDEESSQYVLTLGTKTNKVGVLKVSLHRDVKPPKMLVVSRKGGRWYVSFCFEDSSIKEPQGRDTVLHDLSHLPEPELSDLVWAGDRGVRDILHGSNGKVYNMATEAEARHTRRERRKHHLQKCLARQQKGSGRRRKTALAIARISEQQANARKDFAHKVSHDLVNKTDFRVFTFEDLKVSNMTRRAKPVPGENGHFLPNGASAKSGLNRSILSKCWGNLVVFTQYKAERADKVTIKVSPHHSSQTCSQCGHTSPANRLGKAFQCIQCGFSSDADFNASQVLKARGVRYVLDQQWKSVKARKKVSFRRKSVSG